MPRDRAPKTTVDPARDLLKSIRREVQEREDEAERLTRALSLVAEQLEHLRGQEAGVRRLIAFSIEEE